MALPTTTTHRGQQHLARGDTAGAITKARNAFAAFDACIPYILDDETGIDAKTTGNTTLYTVPTGNNMIAWGAIAIPYSLSSPTTNPYISIGTNSRSYDNLLSDSQLDVNGAQDHKLIPFGQQPGNLSLGLYLGDISATKSFDIYTFGHAAKLARARPMGGAVTANDTDY